MTNSTSQFDRQRFRHRRGQGGFGLLEAIIGMVMVTLLIGAGVTGLKTLQNTSTSANKIARLDAALVAAGESVKNAEYQECARTSDYEPALAGLAQNTVSGPQDLTIETVSQGGCADTSDVDSGIQEIGLKATKDGKERSSTVTKIDANKRLKLPKAVIDHPAIEQATPGDVQAIFGLTANESSGEEGLISFDWDCGDTTNVKASFNTGAEMMFCTYLAGGSGRDVTVTLTVTDRRGQKSQTSKNLTVAPTLVPRAEPLAKATASPRPSSPPSQAPLTVDFSSVGSQSLDGTITGYSWHFGDGSALSTEANPVHVFQAGGNYNVILTVTDDLGQQGTDRVEVTVVDPDEPAPIAELAELPWHYENSTVKFDASGSRPANDTSAAIGKYTWDFGDGQPPVVTQAPIAVITHPFGAAKLYTVKVTVTDQDGLSGSAIQYLDIKPLAPPSNSRLTGAEATRVWPRYRSGYISFAWDRIDPGSTGDPVAVRIEIDKDRRPFPLPLCWDLRTKTVLQTSQSSTQTFTWRAPVGSGPLNVFDFTDMFCSGSGITYRFQMVRNPGASNETSGVWSDKERWEFK
jgi:PKD repeat protein/Tfp pilus assembly protein PilX